jgi:hypothetical protein
MITEAQLRLLTAAIDGVLTPREAKRLARLLDASPAVRLAFARLKADSDRLRTLSRVGPPPNLHKRVMARVATATPHHTRPQAEPAQPAALPYTGKTPRWVPAAVAAGLLICVTGSSFWFFSKPGNAGSTARTPKRPPPGTSAGASDPAWANWLPSDSAPPQAVPTPRERPEQPFAVRPDVGPPQPDTHTPRAIAPDAVAIAPEPRTSHGDLFGAKPIPETHFDLVQVRIPFLKTLSEFEHAEIRQELTAELGRDPAFRIDLFSRDPARGVEVFQAAAKTAGLSILADATTLDRLKKRQINSVVIYTESLTPAGLSELFAKLCAEDAKISPRVFDVLHSAPASTDDARDIKSILGIDPGLFKRPAAEKSDKPADPSKSISAGTADHIVKSVTKAGEKSAVLMTWAPANGRTNSGNSVELKQFRDKRGDRKADVVPVIIVIRPGNG